MSVSAVLHIATTSTLRLESDGQVDVVITVQYSIVEVEGVIRIPGRQLTPGSELHWHRPWGRQPGKAWTSSGVKTLGT